MRHDAAVISIAVQRMACTACGSEANATCNCGKPYMPKKQRAREAIEANPQKSNRAIAEETGLAEATVRRAREGASYDAPEEREGRDGKVYRLPVREAEPEYDTPEEIWYRGLCHRAGEAIAAATFSNWPQQYGNYKNFKITSELVTLAEQASEEWRRLADHLRSIQ